MFGGLFRRSSPLSFPSHYRETSSKAPGSLRELALTRTQVAGSCVRMIYTWSEDLEYQEADNLDSRVRAFVACAIPDAAADAGLACQAGPQFGQRPAWFVAGVPMPVSLVQGAFNVDAKACMVTVGPIVVRGPSVDSRGMPTMDPMARAEAEPTNPAAEHLAAGFQSRFGRIRV
jgi:hypothetical protein